MISLEEVKRMVDRNNVEALAIEAYIIYCANNGIEKLTRTNLSPQIVSTLRKNGFTVEEDGIYYEISGW